jgi:hypothetical protein
MKPRIFIGSSKESEHVANAVHTCLQREAECTVWTQGVFRLSVSNIQNLMREVHTSEFGIFVFSPDDIVEMRGSLFSAPRDNVVYELGLFSGALGPERCFFLIPLDGDIHMPSDLLGITPGRYESGRSDQNMEAAVGPFCEKVRQKLKELALDVRFVDPMPNVRLPVGWQTVTCECTPRPGGEVFLFTEKDNRWWPRRERLEPTTGNLYRAKTNFDGPGRHTIQVIKTNGLALAWVENYFKILDQIKRTPAMIQGELPRGFVSLASIAIEVVTNPHNS